MRPMLEVYAEPQGGANVESWVVGQVTDLEAV